MSRRRVHLRAGRSLVIRVVAQKSLVKVEVVTEQPLQTIVPLSRVESGSSSSYYAELTGHSPLKVVPLPISGKLHVVILDGCPSPCRITIPVTIWPSVWTLVLWWLLAYFSIVGVRFQSSIANSSSPWEIISTVRGDLGYLAGLLLMGFFVLVPLRALGWFLTLVEPSDGSDA